jgi:selenide, water dikinase
MPRSLVLVGGGHAHIEVIRRWGHEPIPGVSLTVIDPNPRPIYSGMVPGFVAGQYQRDDIELDLAGLCDKVGATYVSELVTSLDLNGQRVFARNRTSVRYDTASIDVGSTVVGTDLPGVREFALASRPMSVLLSDFDTLLDKARNSASESFRVYVVGSGAGGIELAFCLDARLRETNLIDYQVSLVSSQPQILSESAPALRRRVEAEAHARGIRLIINSRVSDLRDGSLLLDDGSAFGFEAALWVTGPAAHSLALDSGLPTDDRGFIRIRPTLQLESHDNVFAVGDCASLEGMKKAGVYAVRSGPLVDHNIRATLCGDALHRYTPQSDFLSLLNLGDGTAVGTKWGLAFQGRTVMWLKDRIDRSFMEKYR